MRMSRKTRVRLARMLRGMRPVALGQTRAGLTLAAVLVMCWQLSASAKADVGSEGASYNEYFRLEWDYDLGQGRGTIRLESYGPYGSRMRVLEHGRFTTLGTTFESMEDHVYDRDVYGDPTYIGTEGGLPLYEYDFNQPVGLEDNTGCGVRIDVTFPTEDVQLRATEFSYEGYTLSTFSGPARLMDPGTLPFVSIQMIPEPAAATLALGAFAAAAGRRRED